MFETPQKHPQDCEGLCKNPNNTVRKNGGFFVGGHTAYLFSHL